MKDASPEITKLCESWRDQLAGAAKSGQAPFAEGLLRMLGWEMPVPFSPKEGAKALSASPYILRAGGQTALVAFFVMPGTLEPPTAVVERGLDFCRTTRTLIDDAASIDVGHVVVSDLYRYYLYDARTEELVLYADTPCAFNRDLLPVLNKDSVERGSLDEVRRQPRSVVARHLREWGRRWAGAISTRSGISEELAGLAIDRIVVLRYLCDHQILHRTKRSLEDRLAALVERAADADAVRIGDDLVKLFHDLWFDMRIDLFEARPELDSALRDDAIAAPLLQEYGLLSAGKFSIATVLESFNYGGPSEKMRVRMVPDVNEERELYLAKQSLDSIDEARIHVDIMEEGYRAIFHWFEKILQLYARLSADFDATSRRKAESRGDIDLFAWSRMDSGRPSACGDRFAHACAHGLRVYYHNARQLRVTRLLLTLYLIRQYSDARLPLGRFPSLAPLLLKRTRAHPEDHVLKLHTAPGQLE